MTIHQFDNLIDKINHFYHNALDIQKLAAFTPEGTWVADEDEEEDGPDTERKPKAESLSDQLVDVARNIEDPNAQSEALLIVDMYNKAVELNDGFNAVKKAISNFVSEQLEDLDEDDEDSPMAVLENILNEMHADLITRAKSAGGGINKGDSQDAIKAIREAKNKFMQDDLQQTFQEQSGFMPARHGPGGGSKQQMEVSPGVFFDPTGGVGMEAGQTQGTGVGFRGRHILKDWGKFYESEKERYLDEVKTDHNPKVVEKKQQLIGLLDKLKLAYTRVNELKDALQVAPDDAMTKTRLTAAMDLFSKLKKERLSLKQSLRQNSLALQEGVLQDEYVALARRGATVDDIEADLTLLKSPENKRKFQLFQELELKKLLNSRDKNKGEETKLRKALIAALPHLSVTETGLKTIQGLLQRIEEASKKKIPIEEVWKMENLEKGKEMGKIPLKQRTEDQVHQFMTRDFSKVKAKGYAKNITDDLAALKSNVKDILGSPSKHKVTEAERVIFKPYVDRIADAFTKGDRSAILETVKKLRPLLQQYAHRTEPFTMFVITIKISREIYAYRDMLNTVGKFEEKPQFTPNEVEMVRKTIAEGDRLHDYMEELQFKRSLPTGVKKVPYKKSATYGTIQRKIVAAKEYLIKLLAERGAR